MPLIKIILLTLLSLVHVKTEDQKLIPTVCPVENFHALEDAIIIDEDLDSERAASVDPETMRQILTYRSTFQRLRIVEAYNNKYKDRTITNRIRRRTTYRCESVLRRSLMSHTEIRYTDLKNAFGDNNVDFDEVVDILGSISYEQYVALNYTVTLYEKKSLLSYIDGKHKQKNWKEGAHKRVVNWCLKRFENIAEKNTWCKDHWDESIDELNNAKDSADRKAFEERLDQVLTYCTNAEIGDIASKTDLLNKVKKIIEKGSDTKFVAETIVRSSINLQDYVAYILHKAVDRSGTKMSVIIRRTVIHSTVDLHSIKLAYAKMFNGTDMAHRILRDVCDTDFTDIKFGVTRPSILCTFYTLKRYFRDPEASCAPEADPLPEEMPDDKKCASS